MQIIVSLKLFNIIINNVFVVNNPYKELTFKVSDVINNSYKHNIDKQINV